MRFEYDSALGCWSLRRYADVQAALKDWRTFAFAQSASIDETAHTRTLRTAMDSFAHARWLQTLQEIPAFGTASELVSEWIEPWCHAAALQLVQHSQDPDGKLRRLARKAFAAGAFVDAPMAENESIELHALLPDTLGPVTVQAFVAVSQTLAAFLANALAALLENGAEYPHTPRALEELLRFAGPSQAVFRYLSEPCASLPRGTRIALRLAEANRDPDLFPDPHRLDFERNAAGHLAFGYGLHACVGAVLIRAAAPVALRHLTKIQGVTSIEWPQSPRSIRSPLAIRIRELGPRELRYKA